MQRNLDVFDPPYSSSQTKGGFTNGRRFLVIVIITMFIFDTMNSIVSVYLVAEDIRTSFGAIPYPRATVALILVDLVMSKLNFFLSDLVIIWRAWSVYEPRPHSVRILLILCVFISFGSVFVDIVLAFKTTLSGLEKTLSYATAKIILPLGLFLTNVIATSLIALKTWRFRNALKEAGADGQGSVRHLVQVLMRLVESGCIYSLLWVVVLLDITQGFSPGVRYMFTNIIPHLACTWGILPGLRMTTTYGTGLVEPPVVPTNTTVTSPLPPVSSYYPASTLSDSVPPSVIVQTAAPPNPGMGSTVSSFPPPGTMPAPGQRPRVSSYGSGMPSGAPLMPPAGPAPMAQNYTEAQAGVPGMPATMTTSTTVPRSRSVGVANSQPYATSGAMMAPYGSGMPQPQMAYGNAGGHGGGGGGGGGGYGGYGGSAGVGVPMTAAPTAQYRPYAQPQMQYAGYGGGYGGGGYGDYGGSAGAGVPMPTVQYGSYAQPQMQYAGYGGGVGVPSSVPAQQAPIIIDTSSRRRHHHHHGHGRRSRSYSHGRHRYD
ncbi:hypothetical protein D9757_011353 [Collybiopsis confluens]|uniref:Uncharacterized protein n=1 Tax=Collybiopsis confluens TaxID=2823264 RepID=A0A8H5GAI5_9AGAR|nr:hypothetical protein D9757_011353 [Collybiopsis confluens]